MHANKIVTLAINISAGFAVTVVGFETLPFPLDIVWGAFNVWLWIVSPMAILLTKSKEEEKNVRTPTTP
jgi:hypothetical protein